jgi:hypothetical protein
MGEKIMAGAYRAVITPPLGIGLEGTFSYRGAEEILDDLAVNALVLSGRGGIAGEGEGAGDEEIAIVSTDIIGFPEALYKDILRRIEAEAGIPQDRLLLAATHTHAGPVIDNNTIAQVGDFGWYLDFLQAQVVTAVRMAQKRKQPVAVGVGRTQKPQYVFNRRLRRPDGRIVMNWIGNEHVQGCVPSGPVDPDLFAIKFQDARGAPVAFIVNYANHNNAAPANALSSDIAGQIGAVLRKVYGPEVVTVFLLGACGNTNWIDIHDPTWLDRDHYRKIGQALGGAVVELEAWMEYPAVTSVEARAAWLHIPERPYRPYDVLDDGTFGPGANDFFTAYRKEQALYGSEEPPVHTLGVSLLKLGEEIAITTAPAELFCDFALEIKARSPVKYTLVSELTNGSYGYIPTREAFEQGGYEVRKIKAGSYLAVDAGERIVAASLGLLEGR